MLIKMKLAWLFYAEKGGWTDREGKLEGETRQTKTLSSNSFVSLPTIYFQWTESKVSVTHGNFLQSDRETFPLVFIFILHSLPLHTIFNSLSSYQKLLGQKNRKMILISYIFSEYKALSKYDPCFAFVYSWLTKFLKPTHFSSWKRCLLLTDENGDVFIEFLEWDCCQIKRENAVWKLLLLSFISSVSAASHFFDYLPGVYHKRQMRLERNEENCLILWQGFH